MEHHLIVPYNPWVASEYNAHINVEVCCTVSAANYLYKHVYEGQGRTAVEIGNGAIALYLDGRYISAHEA